MKTAQIKTISKIFVSVTILFFLLGANFSELIKVPDISKRINKFSIAFLKQNAQASDAPANTIMSPQSIFHCLAMSYIASGGDTRKELASVCRFSESNEELARDIQELRQQLLKDKQIDVRIANSAWLNSSRADFRKDYVNEVEKSFGSSISSIDFREKEKSSNIVNAWAAKNTNEKINNVVSPEDFESINLPFFKNGTALLLANVVYFKADWGSCFNKSDTEEKTFHIDRSAKTKTMMMHQNSLLRYLENDKFKFLELPYIGNTYSMHVILPKEIIPIKKLMEEITSEMINEMEGRAYTAQVDTLFPKFEMQNRLDVKDSLKAMGIKAAFDSSVDFDKMINNRLDAFAIYISKIRQDAWIEVNEKGTKAAAVTHVIMKMKSLPPYYKHVTFHADHPFLFLIVHNQSRSILFGGWVSNTDEFK